MFHLSLSRLLGLAVVSSSWLGFLLLGLGWAGSQPKTNDHLRSSFSSDIQLPEYSWMAGSSVSELTQHHEFVTLLWLGLHLTGSLSQHFLIYSSLWWRIFFTSSIVVQGIYSLYESPDGNYGFALSGINRSHSECKKRVNLAVSANSIQLSGDSFLSSKPKLKHKQLHEACNTIGLHLMAQSLPFQFLD